MSITWLNPFSSSPSIRTGDLESIVSQETVYQWHVREFTVYLVKEDDSLWYITTDQNRKEIRTGKIRTSGTRTLEEEIIHLKQSRVFLHEDGVANFTRAYHTWRNPGREIDEFEETIHSPEDDFIRSFSRYQKWEYDPNTEIILTRVNEDLVWNIFRRVSRKDSSFLNFRESTVPSLRCHPETIALIEKIKAEAFSNPQHILCLIRDFKVRVINAEDFKKKYEELKIYLKDFTTTEVFKAGLAGVAGSFGAVSLTEGACVAAAASVNTFFGGGVSGYLAAASLQFCALPVVLGCGFIVPFAAFAYFLSKDPQVIYEKAADIKKRIETLPHKYPALLIEIEPISLPSVFDPRVRVSKFTWSVTVITNGGIISKSHAEIIIEGINDGFFDHRSSRFGKAEVGEVGEKFIYKAEFNPPIESGILSPKDLKYDTRTEIWMRTSDKVKEMIKDIEEEKSLPADKRHRKFNLRGISAVACFFEPRKGTLLRFCGKLGDNCYTFDRDHLKKLDIDPGSGYADLIGALAINYTKPPEAYKELPVKEII